MPRINELTTSINSAETVKMAIFERGLIMPGNLMARQTLCFSLRLGARLAIQSAEELEVPLGRLVEAADVETTLIEQQLLRVKLTPNIDQRCKYTSCYIPPSFSGNAVVTVRAVSVARRPEMGLTF